ncbi:PucR family transcriptional regulator [Clostridium estertheticum]|uniref:helix-turn-helix domain-containing protein n=1 Tax=Clostridium estertheticum TaxID=238834 RepID=UPI001C0DDEA3|nr:PucR family transcriptional regulator [Clostridium estertheticum]MBU3174919.1 PucR family transcriptional regulator [Clostridium estertheticum]
MNLIKKKEDLHYKGQFLKDQFVITSLLFAKNNTELILKALRYLVGDEVSGLAIKNIYFNDLPQEIINFANENAFPIFIFDNSIFFEDIITEIMDRIKFTQNYELMETKIGIIVKKNISGDMIKEISLGINNLFKEAFFIVYCKEKKYVGDDRLISVLERLKFNRNIKSDTSILKYKNGILIICTYDVIKEGNLKNNINNFIDFSGLNRSSYYIGISNQHTTLEEMGKGVNESIFASTVSETANESLYFYKDTGIYKILLPYASETWMKSYYIEIIRPLKEYDKKYQTEIFDTAVKYIENDGVKKATAADLFIHENTVRYRIKKIKQILDMEKLEGSFYEQISIAIKLYKLYEKNYL